MKTFIPHIRTYIFRGLLAIIPIFLCFLAIQLLYVLIDKRVMGFLGHFIEVRQIPGMGILLVLLCLYVTGMVVSNVIGRQFLHFIDRVSQRIPIIKAIYQVGKQLSQGLSSAKDTQAFKKVVLVDFGGKGIWAVAFVAGKLADQRTGESMLRIFIPTVPNPTSGFIFVVKESETIDPGWTMEEGVKMIVSGAIISPEEIRKAL
jgi:uncharacterized membrane protein